MRSPVDQYRQLLAHSFRPAAVQQSANQPSRPTRRVSTGSMCVFFLRKKVSDPACVRAFGPFFETPPSNGRRDRVPSAERRARRRTLPDHMPVPMEPSWVDDALRGPPLPRTLLCRLRFHGKNRRGPDGGRVRRRVAVRGIARSGSGRRASRTRCLGFSAASSGDPSEGRSAAAAAAITHSVIVCFSGSPTHMESTCFFSLAFVALNNFS